MMDGLEVTPTVRLLAGLPPYGPVATPIPEEWGRSGHEGVVVECEVDGERWVANVRPGLHGLTLARPHPDGRRVVVVAMGDLWEIDPCERTGVLSLPAILSALEVRDPDGWVFSRQDIALARLGPKGLLWHTRRLSVDGFDQLRIEDGSVVGLAWTMEEWRPFRVDLRTGKSQGGWRDAFEDMEELGDLDGER